MDLNATGHLDGAVTTTTGHVDSASLHQGWVVVHMAGEGWREANERTVGGEGFGAEKGKGEMEYLNLKKVNVVIL